MRFCYFGQLIMQNAWSLCMRREALERLQDIASERLVETVRRLELDGAVFKELEAR